MWPKLLDLTQDECRGALRRLELETYSNVVGAFRAQGILNAAKLRILKDLREAFHISDARHKAEVRRVVNDESLSTIAKMTYGPNTEIEWNKEGSRGFLIINRKPPQSALSAVADKATKLAETLNKGLRPPSETSRSRTLNLNDDANASDSIVISDPTDIKSKPKTEKPALVQAANAELKKKDSNKHVSIVEPLPSKSFAASAVKNESTESMELEERQASTVVSIPATPAPVVVKAAASSPVPAPPPPAQLAAPKPNPITSNSRRRKSTTALVNYSTPPKAILISNRRDTMIETSPKIREHHPPEVSHQQPTKLAANEVRMIPKKINELRNEELTTNMTPVCSPKNVISQTKSKDGDVQIIEAVMPHKVSTIKGTRNVMNAISQGAQLVKVIDSKIIKKPITIPNIFMSKPAQNQPLKVTAVKQTFTPVKTSNIEYLAVNDCAKLSKPFKGHKIQVIPSNATCIAKNVVQKAPNRENDIISIPTARNPNIVKTSDKTIMHVSPNLSQKSQIKTTVLGTAAQNHTKYQQKRVIQVMQPQSQPRMLTIHPNTAVLKVPAHVSSSVNEAPQEYVYEEQINDWQNYDPRHIDNQNGYVKIVNRLRDVSNNERDYHNHETHVMTENIIYDDEIITEDYITTEDYTTDNVIEMETDSTSYTTNDVTFVSNNVEGS